MIDLVDFRSEAHLVDVLLKLNLVLVSVHLTLLALRLVVQLFPLVARACVAARIVILSSSLVLVNIRREGALFSLWVFFLLLLQVLLTPALVLLSTADQVVFIGAADINLLLLDHLIEDFLRFLVNGGPAIRLNSRRSCESLLLTVLPLLQDEVCATLAQLLELLVPFLHFESAEHVVSRSLIDRADKLWVRVADLGNIAQLESKDCAQIDPQVSHNDSLTVVLDLLAVLIYSLIHLRITSNRL